ncbi:MAG: HK97 gp10 family phage protein [Alphaproteobacteria bacterium]|nr:HK97 gp10 family phage protein [Alphaproteobacteria bacterium]
MISITVNDSAAMARLTAMPQVVRRKIVEVTRRLGFDLQQHVQSDKLSGQVLGTRSNTLRSSINTQFEKYGDTFTATVGTDVFYAKFHEFGVSRSWLIQARNAKALRFRVGGRTLFRKRVTHPPLPERSFLRPALGDMTPMILAEYARAVTEAVH